MDKKKVLTPEEILAIDNALRAAGFKPVERMCHDLSREGTREVELIKQLAPETLSLPEGVALSETGDLLLSREGGVTLPFLGTFRVQHKESVSVNTHYLFGTQPERRAEVRLLNGELEKVVIIYDDYFYSPK